MLPRVKGRLNFTKDVILEQGHAVGAGQEERRGRAEGEQTVGKRTG